MMRIVQFLLMLLYALLPAAVLFWSLSRRLRHQHTGPVISLAFTVITGSVLGAVLLFINVRLMGGTLAFMEGARFVYVLIAAVCLVKLVDTLSLRLLYRWAAVPLDMLGRPRLPHPPRALLILLAQRAVLVTLIVPYGFSLLITYRPRLLLGGAPTQVQMLPVPRFVEAPYEPVQFRSSDGVRLSGWWVPAAAPPGGLLPDQATRWAQRSVILCHGVGSGKERQHSLGAALAANGYNVLAFDFRAHGDSGGNLISYGDRERYDVLAAVRWLRQNRAAASKRIYGIGVNTGAAALLAAAAEPGEGAAIDALVLCEPYARFETLADGIARRTLPGPVAWLVHHVGLPLAGLHAGADLRNFRPVDFAPSVWPRPVLVIFGRAQTFVPISEQLEVFRAATAPKDSYWPADNYEQSRSRLQEARTEAAVLTTMFRVWLGLRDSIEDDPGVQQRAMRFLEVLEVLEDPPIIPVI